MIKPLSTIALGVALLGAGCNKKDDPKPAPAPAAAKPTEAPKADPKPEAPKAAPAKAQAGEPSDKDKELVRTAAPDQAELAWASPAGDKVTVKAVKRLAGDTFVVDVVIADKVVETIKTGAEKPDANGFTHYEPKASVSALPDGVLVVAGTTKITGKPDDSFDARVLTWDATGKQLAVSRTIAFSDTYDPSMDK